MKYILYKLDYAGGRYVIVDEKGKFLQFILNSYSGTVSSSFGSIRDLLFMIERKYDCGFGENISLQVNFNDLKNRLSRTPLESLELEYLKRELSHILIVE